MIDWKEKFDGLVSELNEEKLELKSKLQLAKIEALEGWDKIEEKFKLDEKYEELKQDKDELRVRMHLAKLELLEEWDNIEDKLHVVKQKADELGDTSEEKLKDGWDLARNAGNEVKQGFAKIRDKFRD